MSNDIYILGVDDEAINRTILEEIFEDSYELICVNNGQECLDSVAQRKPDLILLDVNMPVMDGIETCKKLRTDPDNRLIPIVFVSALVSNEEKLRGYEAGADEYISKPFNTDELVTKVKIILKQSADIAELQQSSDFAMQTAMTAMTNSSELGLVIRFLQESFDCKNYQALAEKAFEYAGQYGVETSLIIIEGNEEIVLFNDNVERPLERTALEQLTNKGRIYTIGNKIIINGERASLLVRNIPLDDEDKIGRLRDHLAVLLDGVDARLKGIENEISIATKKQELSEAIQLTHNEINEIDSVHRTQQLGVTQVLSDIGANIEKVFIKLGLTGEQEQMLVDFISNAEKSTEELYKKSVELDQRFENILSKLQSVL